jgi:hypothetical protein
MKVQVYIQGQRLDLFQDETISVKQVIQDIKDISKLFGDYSQSFTVPASKRNNDIFKNFYNADIVNGFDARTRVQGSIDVNTLDFKRGKIRLDGVEVKNNKPTSYRITFFGNAIKIKDLLGEDYLSQLTWLDNFDHDYSGDAVKTGLTTGIDFTVDGVDYDKAIVYPLIAYERQFYYNSDTGDHTNTDQLVNISYHSGDTSDEHGVKNGELKPAISLYVIIQAIIEQYGFNFISPFFDSNRFRAIYMNLNNSTNSISNGSNVYEVVSGVFTPSQPNYIGLAYDYFTTVTPDSGFENVDYKIRLTLNDITVYESQNFISGTQTRGNDFGSDFDTDYSVTAEIITNQDFNFSATTQLTSVSSTGLDIVQEIVFTNSYTSQVIDLVSDISNLLPKIKVFDFITNIFKTFNLIPEARGDDIYVQDLQSWYSEGEIFDITQFVDLKKQTVNRGRIYKQINFKFEQSSQILADEYAQSNLQTYGNLEFKLAGLNGESLEDIDGDVLDIESIFENPIFERLFNTNDNSETSIQYCPYFDRDINSISENPFIFYVNTVDVSSNPIGYINDGVYEGLSTNVIMPSHSYLINANSFNLNFNAEINEYTSIVMQDTIYKRFFNDFIIDMFSVKRRIYNYEAILPDYLLQNIRLNDRVIIKDRRYIINSIESDLTERQDRLELINDIYDAPLQSDSLNTSLFRSTSRVFQSNSGSFDLEYIGLSGKTVSAEDTGDGNSWVNILTKTTDRNVFNISFTLTENTTGIDRTVGIKVTDGLNDPIFTFIQLTT